MQGLDLAVQGKRDVQFAITRDAGRFDCEGYLKDGEGAGIFHFTPDASYVKSMKALGFTGIDDEKQFAMAVHDVTLEFAKAMKAEKLDGPRHRQAHRVPDSSTSRRSSSARCVPKD